VARARQPNDWDRDLAAARASEAQVAAELSRHRLVTHLADYTAEMDTLDFEFRFEGERVRIDVKEKRSRYTGDYCKFSSSPIGPRLLAENFPNQAVLVTCYTPGRATRAPAEALAERNSQDAGFFDGRSPP
jgi:hypothetical protein